jgi:hypothetical protein
MVLKKVPELDEVKKFFKDSHCNYLQWLLSCKQIVWQQFRND